MPVKKPRKQIAYKSARCPNEFEKYGPETLPPGWQKLVKTRKAGKTAGKIDVYFITYVTSTSIRFAVLHF